MHQDLEDKKNRKQDEDRTALVTSELRIASKNSPVKINERQVREKIEKEHLSDREKKLDEFKIMITGSTFDELFRFFDFMKHNTNERNISKCFMTEGSLQLNLKRYFGHKTTFLEARLYSVLSRGQTNRRIYFDQFIDEFYTPLFEKTPIVKADFMFRMLDFDGDGILHAHDLVQAAEFIDELSDFG